MGKVAGLLFVVAGFIIWMGITTAEIYYPGYSVSKDFISNLGSSRPPIIIIKQPSADIFDITMIAAGVSIVLGGLLLAAKNGKLFKAAILFTGAGSMGVGLIPAYHGIIHDLIAFTSFISAAIAAILSSKITPSPFKYLAIILGSITLGLLFLGVFAPHLVVSYLGVGGVERWVAYPAIIWLIMFGGYLMGSKGRQD